ncbi:MAG TPA: hypothetical protein VKX49_30400 [Bryobacteraceae bacterium]|nr:hypothetical protein [Bryobacteraceae bacterium]
MGRAWVRLFTFLLAAALLEGVDKKLPIEQTSNELVSISAAALTDRDQIQHELGSDLGSDMVVVRVTFRPVSDKPIQIDLDDFLLVCDKGDFQRAHPLAPSQIAGSTTLVVTQEAGRGGGKSSRPTFGGFGLGGMVGSSPGTKAPADSKVEVSKSDKENPLLAVLTAKGLPEKETKDEVSGLLYFQINGKVKPKDLELHYKGAGGQLALRFHP